MRRLAALAVRFRVTFLMIYIGVLGVGAYFGSQLKLDMYPDITYPAITVITSYTGASPEDIEQLVTRPIEEACAAVENVEHVNSESRDGASLVFIEFAWGTDLDQAEVDLRRNMDFTRELLPADATEPILFAFDPSMQPILFYGISGPYNQAQLREISEREIEPRLERAVGVASVDTIGGLEREIMVEVLPDRLAAAGIPVNQLIGALRAENAQIPGGAVRHADRELGIQIQGGYETVDEIRETVVGMAGRVPLRARDLTNVRDTVAEQTRIIRADGRPAVMLMVRKQSGANTVQAVEAVEELLPELYEKLPAGVELQKIFSQGDFIAESLGNLGSTGLLAIAMAVVVLLVFLRSVRASIIVGMAIPVSVVVTFTVMYAVDVTLNIISMAGLALAVGMLVDNSIVVLENIYRHLEAGEDGDRAAVRGAGEVSTAIFGSTLTTIAVFLPVLFVPGIAGAMFRDMALTICISLGASFLVAITLIPMASATIIRRRERRREPRVSAFYGVVQGAVMRNRGTRAAFFLAALALAAASVLAILFLVGTEFFPKEDRGMAIFRVKAQVGSSVEHLDELVGPVEERILESVPELEVMSVDLGRDEGFAAMFSEGQHVGLVRLRLVPLDQRERSQEEIEEQIREMMDEVPGMEGKVFQPFNPMGESDITVEIVGHDIETARRVGSEIKKIIQEMEGAEDVVFGLEEPRPEYGLVFDRELMSRLGLTVAEVSSAVSAFFQGTIASIFREEGEDHDIRVRAPRSYREEPDNLEDMVVVSPLAGAVPLRSIASVEEFAGPVKITRQDQRRAFAIDANSVSDDLQGLITKIEERLDEYDWPEGFRYQIGGSAEDFIESFQYLTIAFLIAMVLVYMVMASLFESFRTPFVITLTIPLGITGVGLSLLITDTVLSIVALIGVVILVGIMVNNSIVLVDHANQMCARGMSRLEALAIAGRHRVRPILMTTLTTSLAMVPLALEIGSGAESWSPLARVVIGGLLTAMVITLLIVPVIYHWLGGGGAARTGRERVEDENW
ncbi:MAG: efflux RND transporter permease subunit [Polyangia bacterium]